MVLLREINSDGNETATPIPEEVEKLIRLAGREMVTTVLVAKSSCLRMNTNPDVVGPIVSKLLTAYKEAIAKHLMLFRDHHLPQSKKTVREVKSTLVTHFQNASFEQFKTLLPHLKKKLKPCRDRAEDVKIRYQLLAADLDRLEVDFYNKVEGGGANLNSAIPKLNDALMQSEKNVIDSENAAQLSNTIGKTTALASIGGSLALAKGLVTTGGLIAAMPILAPVVVTAGIALAVMAREEGSSTSKQSKEEAAKAKVACSQIRDTLEVVEDVNNRAIKKFAECLHGCAAFFSYIESELEVLSDPGVDTTETDEVLKLIFQSLKNQADPLISACIEYAQCAGQVETNLEALDSLKPEKYREEKDKWIRMADEKVDAKLRDNA